LSTANLYCTFNKNSALFVFFHIFSAAATTRFCVRVIFLPNQNKIKFLYCGKKAMQISTAYKISCLPQYFSAAGIKINL
jgi:hypothetical protein